MSYSSYREVQIAKQTLNESRKDVYPFSKEEKELLKTVGFRHIASGIQEMGVDENIVYRIHKLSGQYVIARAIKNAGESYVKKWYATQSTSEADMSRLADLLKDAGIFSDMDMLDTPYTPKNSVNDRIRF